MHPQNVVETFTVDERSNPSCTDTQSFSLDLVIFTAAGMTTDSQQLTVIGDNASDRGYHSDQSPDSVTDKPITATTNATTSAAAKKGKGRKPKSARRPLISTEPKGLDITYPKLYLDGKFIKSMHVEGLYKPL